MPDLPDPGQPIGEPQEWNPSPATSVMPVQESGAKHARPLPCQPNANLDGFTLGSAGAVQANLSFSNNGPHAARASHRGPESLPAALHR